METLVLQALAAKRAHKRLLAASMFSRDGKLAVVVLELAGSTALVTAAAPPPVGSAAVLARNGMRLVATVVAADAGRVTLRLDDPLDDGRREWFVGAAGQLPAVALAA